MSRIRLVPVIFIALISLVVLFGGWWAYRQYNVVNPLKDHLEGVHGVQTVQVETGNPGQVLIKLGAVKDLQSTYLTITQAVRGVYGDPQAVHLSIQDNRNSDLSDIYETLKPFIMEGVVKGNYTEMMSQVKQKALQLHADSANITMDQQNVYVQLTQGNHYLYDVMPLSTLRQGGGAS